MNNAPANSSSKDEDFSRKRNNIQGPSNSIDERKRGPKRRGRVNYEANVPFQIREPEKSKPASENANPNYSVPVEKHAMGNQRIPLSLINQNVSSGKSFTGFPKPLKEKFTDVKHGHSLQNQSSTPISKGRPHITSQSAVTNEQCDVRNVGASIVFDKRQSQTISNTCPKISRGYSTNARSIQRSPLIENVDFLDEILLRNTSESSSSTMMMNYSTPPPGGFNYTYRETVVEDNTPNISAPTTMSTYPTSSQIRYSIDCAGSKVVASNTIMSTISKLDVCSDNEVNFSIDAIPFTLRGGRDELLHTHYSSRLARPCLNPSINPKIAHIPNQPIEKLSKCEQGKEVRCRCCRIVKSDQCCQRLLNSYPTILIVVPPDFIKVTSLLFGLGGIIIQF